MARYDDCALAVCRFIYIGYELSRLHLMGTSHLYGWYVLNGFPSGMSAKLYGAWTGKGQSAFSLFKKNYSADSADLYFALFLGRQGICCLFGRANQRYFGSNCNDNYIFMRFDKILEVGVQVKKGD